MHRGLHSTVKKLQKLSHRMCALATSVFTVVGLPTPRHRNSYATSTIYAIWLNRLDCLIWNQHRKCAWLWLICRKSNCYAMLTIYLTVKGDVKRKSKSDWFAHRKCAWLWLICRKSNCYAMLTIYLTVKGDVKQKSKWLICLKSNLTVKGDVKQKSKSDWFAWNRTWLLKEMWNKNQSDWFAWNRTWLLKGMWNKNQKVIDLPEIEPDC